MIARLTVFGSILIPILYFGLQAAFAPFYPDYSLWTTTASDLGAATSPVGPVFSACILILGGIMTVTALTVPAALRSHGLPLWRACLPAIGLFSGALITISAGLFPQPHPNHAGGVLGAGFIALPLLLPIALWPVAPPGVRAYLLANLLTFAAIALVMAEVVPLADAQAQGLVQKLLALTLFVPPAVVAITLRPGLG
jgi:hypothetical membrane protein